MYPQVWNDKSLEFSIRIDPLFILIVVEFCHHLTSRSTKSSDNNEVY